VSAKRDIILIIVAVVLMFAGLAKGADRLITKPPVPIKSLSVQIPVVLTLKPFVMTGLRGGIPEFQPVSINVGPFSMTGLRGSVATFQPVTLAVSQFTMTGLRGTVVEFKPVTLTLPPFTMTGMRP
jgi:hypothetical protein